MKQMTPEMIAKACGGRYHGPEEIKHTEVTSVTTDSRKCEPGCLYIPMRGTRVDGHDYIPQVMEAGALVTLTEHAEGVSEYPYILVKDTAEAIQEIAGYYRRVLDLPVVSITGSVGKTSTKEMIAAVLSQKFRVLKTLGNFNNNLGLPLTVFRLTEEDEIAVLEMGISHFGEMTKLAETAEPDTMVITNIGECHLEALGDRDGVFKAKTECFDYVRLNGTVILNGEDDKLAAVEDVHARRPIFYGMDPRFRVYADEICPQGLKGTRCTIHVDEEAFEVLVPLPGRHMVMNALAGAAVGYTYGLTAEEIKAGIESLESLAGRLHILEKNGVTVIDDCYNANPMSMKASVGILKEAEGRRIAILGDMGELGKTEAALHREVGEAVGTMGIERFVLVGSLVKNLADGIAAVSPETEVLQFDELETALEKLPELVQEGDTVLVKASHFMHFEKIVEKLTV
ncbi:MAG: UDP-N-acetylmuramoyl-tripeptide--D-alanyl-D-alanine ligase [Lachnospiraceae bacterium]|nr:UDP-N-acetylmuramoyl-tripeptide--D-alanyl-D-alanine ligase [Lachnospiraceae bacterium]